MSHSIRRLTEDDVEAYRAIRSEALTNHPESYGTAAEKFAAVPQAEVQGFLNRQAVFGVLDSAGALSGIAAYARDPGERESHRGWLIQVYLKPEFAGYGGRPDADRSGGRARQNRSDPASSYGWGA